MGRWKEEQEKNKLQNTKTQEQDQLERSIPCRPFIFHSPLNQQSGNQQKGKTTQAQVQSRAQHDTLQRNTVYDHAPPNNVRPKNADPLTANYSTRALHYAALQAHHGLPRKPGKHNRCPSQYSSQYPSTHRQKHAQTHLRMHYHRRPGPSASCYRAANNSTATGARTSKPPALTSARGKKKIDAAGPGRHFA